MLAATVLTGRTMRDVAEALPRLLARFPRAIRCIRGDHGAAFPPGVTDLLAEGGIRHAHTRPRCPHLSGEVERVQRTSAEEFWDGVAGTDPLRWERDLHAYVRSCNTARLHPALGYDTPARFARRRLTDPPPCHVS
jgi:transposase InsO family protein